eukprot:CAMPEP_0204189850 /NCGR_PEP_ID=MMETSP0361-20130328/58831_1 /ASSEMBLY_ACC=CAM_ASM_000343 /TAXON_ID=268821 /ORGANISM="Scrippsiella Hangoei, Strain SHTV-5" /LENGTH=120 /DNA_ID=CAMNT_0051150581 /DNA_START=61 /DNA_END=420 /DNA_ORIENTATION=+
MGSSREGFASSSSSLPHAPANTSTTECEARQDGAPLSGAIRDLGRDCATTLEGSPKVYLFFSQLVVIAGIAALLVPRTGWSPGLREDLNRPSLAGTAAARARDAYLHAWTLSSHAPRLQP